LEHIEVIKVLAWSMETFEKTELANLLIFS